MLVKSDTETLLKPEGDVLAEENAGIAHVIDYFFEPGSEGGVEDVAVGDVLGADGQIVAGEMRMEPLVDQLVSVFAPLGIS